MIQMAASTAMGAPFSWSRRGLTSIASIWSFSSPDYSWTGVWRMSGVDHTRTLTRQYNYRRFPPRPGIEIHLSGGRWVLPILGLIWRYMPRCVGSLNNQG